MKLLPIFMILLLNVGCLSDGDEVSVKVTKGPSPSPDLTPDDPTEDPPDETNNDSSLQDIQITPKSAIAGDSIDLSTRLKKFVTITNTSSNSVSGELSISGSNAIELVTVSNCSYNDSNISYNLNSNESATFMVVRSSDFQTNISANLVNTINSISTNTAISSLSLGYEFIFWFNPKDILFSDLASDNDSSADVSNADEINILRDRSGNNFNLTASNSTSYATIIENGNNGQRNIQMNSRYNYPASLVGTSYVGTFGNLGFPNDGSSVMYILSHDIDTINNSNRYQLNTHVSGGSALTYYGPDLNTSVPTQSGKYGFYANRNAFEVTSVTHTDAHIYSLYFPNTSVNTPISTNTNIYFNNDLQTLSNTNTYTNGGNKFTSTFSDSNSINLIYEAKIHEIMIIKGVDSEDERLDILCYQALKNGININECN